MYEEVFVMMGTWPKLESTGNGKEHLKNSRKSDSTINNDFK